MDQDQPSSQWQKVLGSWGRQTIAFAMCQRAMDLEKSLDPANETRTRAAAIEVQETTQRFWTEALEAAGDPTNPPKFQAEFVRRVFAWCYDHLDSGGRGS